MASLLATFLLDPLYNLSHLAVTRLFSVLITGGLTLLLGLVLWWRREWVERSILAVLRGVWIIILMSLFANIVWDFQTKPDFQAACRVAVKDWIDYFTPLAQETHFNVDAPKPKTAPPALPFIDESVGSDLDYTARVAVHTVCCRNANGFVRIDTVEPAQYIALKHCFFPYQAPHHLNDDCKGL